MDTDITICMDNDVKEKADALFSELGMDLNTAFNLFVRESLRAGGFPFELRPNKKVIWIPIIYRWRFKRNVEQKYSGYRLSAYDW